jgi:hypothetical protein
MAQKPKSNESAESGESTALANRETNSGLVPSFMASAPSGKENIERGDMIIPRVALAQSTHEWVEEGKIRAGNFWHTVLEKDLGKSLEDLVIVHHSKRWNLWKPRHEGGGILARATDGRRWDESFRGMEFEVQPDKNRPRHRVKWRIDEDGQIGRDIGLGAWGTSDPDNPDSQPAATLSHVLIGVSLERLHEGPFVILLQRTSEKVARGLLAKVSADQAPIYGQVYRMSSKADSGPSGDYQQYVFNKNGYVPDEATFNRLMAMNEEFTRMAGINIDERGGEEEGASGGGGGAPSGDGGASDGRY